MIRSSVGRICTFHKCIAQQIFSQNSHRVVEDAPNPSELSFLESSKNARKVCGGYDDE